MKQFIIKNNDAGQRLDKFILKSVKKLPKNLMYKYIRTKRIKVNNKRCSINQILEIDDVVEMYINDEFFEGKKVLDFLYASNSIEIIYEDENIALINKSIGVIVHEDREQTIDTLINRFKRYLYEKGEYCPDREISFAPSLCNRIDRNTGGIVIAAKNAQSLKILNQKIKDREIKKLYLCLIKGVPAVKAQTLTNYLKKDDDLNKVFISDAKQDDNKTIITHYNVLESKGNYSLVEINLLTGRTHQIRAHMAYIGHPLIGDGKYGNNRRDKVTGFKHQALYSYKLVFEFETDAEILNYLNKKEFEVSKVWFKEKFHNNQVI